jgi:excisionase family DNA binding protein
MPELRSIQVINGLLNMDEAANYLGIKKATLYDMVMRREISVIKIGRLNKFKLQDLETFVNQNRTEAVQ